ncbi:hypothetical protein HZH66_004545 [Vespula vulgaris]|uniref:Uncharacterized protein n=1 Tax=Vespula vulgaris TaxID=7454 RepID=A0A834K8Q8_VESVU|nr:hypothetical protein HZH66_004545 [Vespula vulgaris]
MENLKCSSNSTGGRSSNSSSSSSSSSSGSRSNSSSTSSTSSSSGEWPHSGDPDQIQNRTLTSWLFSVFAKKFRDIPLEWRRKSGELARKTRRHELEQSRSHRKFSRTNNNRRKEEEEEDEKEHEEEEKKGEQGWE